MPCDILNFFLSHSHPANSSRTITEDEEKEVKKTAAEADAGKLVEGTNEDAMNNFFLVSLFYIF
jgi:hypothetical protein